MLGLSVRTLRRREERHEAAGQKVSHDRRPGKGDNTRVPAETGNGDAGDLSRARMPGPRHGRRIAPRQGASPTESRGTRCDTRTQRPSTEADNQQET